MARRSEDTVEGNPVGSGDLVICGTANGRVVGLELLTGEEKLRFALREEPIIESVAGSRGFAVFGAMDTVVRRFQLQPGAKVVKAARKGMRRHVRCLAVDSRGRLVASGHSWQQTHPPPPVFIHDSERMRVLDELEVSGSRTGLSFSPDDSTLVSCGTDRVLRSWATDDWSVTAERHLRGTPLVCLAVHPGGEAVVTGHGHSAEDPEFSCCSLFWSVGLDRLSDEITPPDGETVARVALHPDGGVLLQGTRAGNVVMWDLDVRAGSVSAGAPRVLAAHPKPINGLAFDAEGRHFLTGTSGGSVRVWEFPSGRLLWGTRPDDPKIAPNDVGYVTASDLATI